jgi:SAM-dependent methyltransferase
MKSALATRIADHESSDTPFRRLMRGIATARFRLMNPRRERFTCPICRYEGPFRHVTPDTGIRRHAACASCGALERHRLQYLVVQAVFSNTDTSLLRMLHFAPESFFRPIFARHFGRYETADIAMPDVDHTVDLLTLPFADASYDVVYASHVLEHIKDDRVAIAEIRRVLAPGGIAILPVPLVATRTVEYPEPNPHEAMHVRAPGPDYFDRLRPFFASTALYSSNDFSARHQLFIHEDRTGLPSAHSPLRPAMPGEKHVDMVPVCRV